MQCDHCLDGDQVFELDQDRRAAIADRARTLNDEVSSSIYLSVLCDKAARSLQAGFLVKHQPTRQCVRECF